MDLRGLSLTNWYTANTANKVTIFHHMLNDEEEGGIRLMALTEIWEVSQQTGVAETMASPPLLPFRRALVGKDGRPTIVGRADMDGNGKVRYRYERGHPGVSETQAGGQARPRLL